MVAWNETEYVQRAGEIAQQHVTSKKPLNELATKIARDNAMNPDEIRTLVRLSNVATFQHLFKDKTDGDKMVEFDTGDPEAVINALVQEAQTPPETANVHNDKLASEIPDFMREKRQGFKFAAMEKTAADGDFVPATERVPRRDSVVLALRKLAEDFEVERIIEGKRWEDKLATLATLLKRPAGYGCSVEDFEKDAYAEYGLGAEPELTQLHLELRLPVPTADPEKVAELQARRVSENTAELRLLKEAHTARMAYQKYANGIIWIKNNMPVL